MMYESCLEKQKYAEEIFFKCSTPEEKYIKLIELGKSLPPLESNECLDHHLVTGCQSTVYLIAELQGGLVRFKAQSDALISAGLAALLVAVYDGESPEAILKCPPDFLQRLGIDASLTPSRANGLYSIHLRMKQEALKLLMRSSG